MALRIVSEQLPPWFAVGAFVVVLFHVWSRVEAIRFRRSGGACAFVGLMFSFALLQFHHCHARGVQV